jgi:putative ABC transport system permease protein
VLALGLGLGITVAIVSAAYAVLYRPLPIPDGERLVVPVGTNAARGIERASVPYADYDDWRLERDLFEHVSVFQPLQVNLVAGEHPERLDGLHVTVEYFRVMAARPLAGRLFGPADVAPDAPLAAVISDGLWRRAFGGDPLVVGRELRLAGTVATVAGIVDASRVWPGEIDVWLPMKTFRLSPDVRTRRDNMIFQAVARLKPGVPIEQARARVAAIAGRVAAEHPESRQAWSTDLLRLRDYIVEPEIRLGMLVLTGGVAFVLLIACVNLANLLLARGADRAREMALRTALGASRARLVRQLMTESLLLAAAGGVTGLAIAAWLVAVLVAAAPPELPMAADIAIDGVALAVAAGLTLGTAMLFGFAPAVAASRFEPAETLRESARGAGAGRRAGRLRDLLVVVEMALAIVLLTGAGLMLRSFERLLRLDPGVDVERILAGRIALQGERYETSADRHQFFDRLTSNLEALPGVEAAAAGSYVPAGGGGFGLGRVFLLEGQPEPPASTDHAAQWNVITPRYFDALGVVLRRGRVFDARDAATSTPVAIINETMARRVFGQADPIGRRMRSWRDENVLRQIVGVVSDVRYRGLADEERSLVFVPHSQNAWGLLTVVVRASGDPAGLAAALRQEVTRLDPAIAVARLQPLSTDAADSIAPQRFATLLLAAFAVAAVVLAGIGIYGVMAYAVSRRGHELGVRMALGSTPAGLFGLVLRRGLVLTIAGSALGLGGALAVGRVMRGLLFGIDPADPITLALVPAVLGAVALAACAVPARRAARTEPLAALRAE